MENINAVSSVVNPSTITTSSDEILKQYLIKALDKTGNMVDSAIDIVQQQVPLLINEVLHWYLTYDLIKFICGIIIIIFVIFLNIKVWELDSEEFVDGGLPVMTICIATISIISLLFTFDTLINLEWLKIWIAPRLWLIEYTSHLVKGVH